MAERTEYRVEGLVLWNKVTDANAFQKRVERNVRRATKLNALAAAKKMREVIQSGSFKANATLTVALKGSTKPLVWSGDLFQAITVEEVTPDEQFVGVTKTEGAYDLVSVVHDGATIPVTPKMRWMFLLLAKASDGSMDPSKLEGRAAELFALHQGWKPLANSTTAITIPSRPFVTITFDSPDLIKLCTDNWTAAINAAFNPSKREPESKATKAAKKTMKRAKKLGAKYGKKATKAAKKYGKKALKSGKKYGKKALKSGKRIGKRVKKAFKGSKSKRKR